MYKSKFRVHSLLKIPNKHNGRRQSQGKRNSSQRREKSWPRKKRSKPTFKSVEEEEQANKGKEKVQEGEQDNLAPSLRTRCEQQSLTMSLSMAEAGLRVRPNLSRFTVATIIRAFIQHNRMPHRGGRVAIFTAAQETLIVDMVRENNLIRLRDIRAKVIANNVNFESIDEVYLRAEQKRQDNQFKIDHRSAYASLTCPGVDEKPHRHTETKEQRAGSYFTYTKHRAWRGKLKRKFRRHIQTNHEHGGHDALEMSEEMFHLTF
ncbi:hypothetical protein C0J50_17703 [Silurus asotus]|uniref:Uncharacterized protein n=1 Tax=Silurus asotus TaxID=30991 RepID=A0AAD5FMS4_SILAS|nr:hypothetical protein C0J50_17703 [Silurus asotus]